jgi:metallophosphoesterase (TIGR00282 family)
MLLPGLREEFELDLILANVENAASGRGIQPASAKEIWGAGVQVFTGGNHIFDRVEGIDLIASDPRIVRPLNLPPGTPGRGVGLYEIGDSTIAVVNLLGRVFMSPVDCPFRAIDATLESLAGRTNLVFVDFHAEASAEKIAFGWHLDGRVSACIGTHTHVQTADERILPGGTAYLSDVGMTGPHDSVIGVRKEEAIRRMVSGLPVRFQTAEADIRLHAVVVEIDEQSGRAVRIERVARSLGQGD